MEILQVLYLLLKASNDKKINKFKIRIENWDNILVVFAVLDGWFYTLIFAIVFFDAMG